MARHGEMAAETDGSLVGGQFRKLGLTVRKSNWVVVFVQRAVSCYAQDFAARVVQN